jgi:hypothetical protein
MRDDELDRIFSDEAGIEPSAGFAAKVMVAVRRQASTPAPIPFPWKCALPGLAAWMLILVLVVVQGFKPAFGPAKASPTILARLLSTLTTLFEGMLGAAKAVGAGWIVLALLLALACTMLSMWFTRGNA